MGDSLNYTPNNKDWFYSTFNIPNLEKIKEEFLPFRILYVDKISVFNPLSKDELKDKVPEFCNFLKSVDLYDRWITTSMCTIPPHQNYPLHIDSLHCKDRFVALNIPIFNCENTYTVWYEAEIDKLIWDKLHGHIHATYDAACHCKWETSVEVKRVESKDPMLINVSIPHSVFNPTERYRFLVSSRFTPELTDNDLKKLGILTSFIQNE